MTAEQTNKPVGVILAGGNGTRMGGQDKGLMEINGRKLVEFAIEALKPQVSDIVVSANRNIHEYQKFASHVISDISPQYHGPLAGIFSVMLFLDKSTRNSDPVSDLLVIPCDMPLLPADLTARLYKARGGNINRHKAVIVDDGDRLQPLCGLLPMVLKPHLEAFLNSGHRKVTHWLQSIDVLTANFSDEKSKFININSPENLSVLEALLESND